MIVKALYLLFLLMFLVLPFFYHRKKSRPSMTKFYLRMAFSHNFRKCYRLVLLSALLMFHFITSPCSNCRWNWPPRPWYACCCSPIGFQSVHSAFCRTNGHFSAWFCSPLSAYLIRRFCRLALLPAHWFSVQRFTPHWRFAAW